MVFISAGSRFFTIQEESKVLNHEIELSQEMIAGRIDGSGSVSAAESPCDEIANIPKTCRSQHFVFASLQRLNEGNNICEQKTRFSVCSLWELPFFTS